MQNQDRQSRVLFVNRFFFPDHSATSQILTDLAAHLAGAGFHVHVVCSRQRYDDPDAALPITGEYEGATAHRVWTSRFGRSSLPGRLIDYLSFYASATLFALRFLRRGDVVVVKTDPPMISVPIGWAARLRGARLVNWLQDLFPEVASALETGFMTGPVGRIAQFCRNASLTSARMNVAIGDVMAQRLTQQGVVPERVKVIPNWSDDEYIRPVPPSENPLRQRWGLEGKFVVGYSGNLGRAHDFRTVLAAARLLSGESSIVFLFIGGGHGLAHLKEACEQRRLGNVVFKPYQPRSALRYSLTLPDAHWVSLKPELEGLIVPSKVYGIAAAGRPMIFLGDADGEVGALVRKNECGGVIAEGDCEGFASLLRNLSRSPETATAFGANARKMVDKRFNRKAALAAWTDVLKDVIGGD